MTATERAASEAEFWRDVATSLSGAEHRYPMTEQSVTGFDPSDDLAKRARRWSYQFDDHTAVALATFAAGLAAAEAEAWSRDDPIIATQALSDRRFLFGDRIVHWLVPVLLAADDVPASELAEQLLALGDRHRPAPALTGTEGLYPPGHDSIGRLVDSIDEAPLLNGWVAEDVDVEGYERAAELWRSFAEQHPGTARLWLDLAARCELSAARVIMA